MKRTLKLMLAASMLLGASTLAAQAAGCEPHLVLSGRAAGLTPEQVQAWQVPVPSARAHASLGAFADFLMQRDNHADSAVGSLS